jgi:hypothetical protein
VVVLNADQDLKGLSIAFADAGSQTFDLKTGAGPGEFRSVRVFAADLDAAKASLSAAIRNANAPGAPSPTDGIIDSGLHGSSGIGIMKRTDHVFIRPTRIGDLNLDGTVTIADFIDLAANFNGVNKTWQEGDLNNDAAVTIADFINLAANFNSTYAGGLAGMGEEDRMLLANFASSIGVDSSVIGSAVPEPATLSLLAVGAMGLMSRRRRKA